MPRSRSAAATIEASREREASATGRTGPTLRLGVVWPRALELAVELTAGALVLGRVPEEGAAPALDHPSVSRRHAELAYDATLGRHLVRDLGSKNGTRVDGVDVGAAWHLLEEGSILRVGDVLLAVERGGLLSAPDAKGGIRAALPGRSLAMRALRAKVARAALDTSPAVVLGETGTGKEWVVRAIHAASGRAGAFVAVSCGEISRELAESKLFGHAKGAFTGASADAEGAFRAAHGGTLFLDEIGELELALQPKLLRALQEREITPVGKARPERVDVRVVAATHRELPALVERGAFRQDLYARLSLWELRVPPLRERRADLLDWLERFHRRWREERGLDASAELLLKPDAAEALLSYDWPDNLRRVDRLVRELASVERAGARIGRAELPGWLS